MDTKTTKKIEKELRGLVKSLSIDQIRILNLFLAEEIINRNIYE